MGASLAEPFLRPVPESLWWCAGVSYVAYAALYRASAEASKRHIPAYNRLSHGKQVDWNTRLPSTVHAIVVSALCLQQLFVGAFGAAASAADGIPSVLRATPVSWAIVGISLGYFTADAFMVFTQEALYGTMIFVHHIVALLSLATAIDIRSAHLYVLFGLFTEITTPFVNLRWRLHEAGAAGGRLYAANGLIMTLVWGLCRVAAFGPLFAHVATHFGDSVRYLPTYALGVLLGVPALLFVLNLLWFAKMVQGLAKLLRNRSDGGAAPIVGANRRPKAAGSSGGALAQAEAAAIAVAGKAPDATVLVEAYAASDAKKEE